MVIKRQKVQTENVILEQSFTKLSGKADRASV